MDHVDRAEPLLSLSEVAELLNIPVTTVYAWRHRGEGPPGYRVGRYVRFRRAAVEAWLEQQADRPRPSYGTDLPRVAS